MSKKELAKKPAAQSVAVAEKMPTDVAELYGAEAETGFEGMGAQDYALPFLKLLQKMSPEVDPDDGAYVKGASAGMYFDTASGELFPTVEFIPCLYRRAMVEWRERDAGGGFIAQHDPGYEQKFKRSDDGKWRTGPDTYLVDTAYYFGLRITADGGTTPDVLSFSSTQLKKARGWNTRMASMRGTLRDGTKFVLPMFAAVWTLSSVAEENDKGSWRGYKIELARLVTDVNFARAAREAREMFRGASDRVRPPETVAESADSDVPF